MTPRDALKHARLPEKTVTRETTTRSFTTVSFLSLR